MGITNWCLGRGGLESSKVYLRLSGIGSPNFSLCLGTILRLPLARFGWSPEVASLVGNPDLRCVNISSRHLSFITFTIIATDSFTSCFAHLKDGPNLRASIRSECIRPSNTRRQLRAGTISWTQGPLPSTILDQNLPPSSCVISILKEKRVSPKIVSVDFFVCFSFFFFNFFFT